MATSLILKLVENPPDINEIRNLILSSDAVYVGGGNTQKMLGVWKVNGVDSILKEAYDRGIVLSGLSAGAICWFEFGSSDSPSFNNPEDKQFVLLQALGFVEGLFSPHHIREPSRNEQLPTILQESGLKSAFAVDDKSALVIIDGKIKVVTSDETRGVKLVSIEDGKVNRISIPKDQEFEYEDLIKSEVRIGKSRPETK